jgi:hypothetical protein
MCWPRSLPLRRLPPRFNTTSINCLLPMSHSRSRLSMPVVHTYRCSSLTIELLFCYLLNLFCTCCSLSGQCGSCSGIQAILSQTTNALDRSATLSGVGTCGQSCQQRQCLARVCRQRRSSIGTPSSSVRLSIVPSSTSSSSIPSRASVLLTFGISLNRLVNLELLTSHGANAWRIHADQVQSRRQWIKSILDQIRKDSEQINRDRKLTQVCLLYNHAAARVTPS